MSEALTVQPRRHLQLPDSCLFAPTELQIGPSISQDDFGRLGKALSAVDQASDLWACDYALAGQKRWGDEGLALAKAATKLSLPYLKLGARIAERFDPSRRFPSLTRNHYRGLCCFPVEFTDTWLPTVAEKGFGAKTLRALAVEAFGSDPKAEYTKTCNSRAVSIPETLYVRFKECANTPKTALFIVEALEDWLSTATPEHMARVDAALLTRVEKHHQRRKAEKLAAREKLRAEAAARKAEVDAFNAAEREKRDAEKARQRAEREAEREKRLAAQDAAAALADERKKAFKDAKEQIRGIEPSLYGSCIKATKYKTLDQAAFMAEKYTSVKGYDFEGFLCEKCSKYHIRVDEVKFEEKRQAALAARAPRPTYAERRAAQKAACSESGNVENAAPLSSYPQVYESERSGRESARPIRVVALRTPGYELKAIFR